MPECRPSVSLYTAMRACMTENRQPAPQEIELVAEKIWHDAYSDRTRLQWTQVEAGSPHHRRTIAAARAALGVGPSSHHRRAA